MTSSLPPTAPFRDVSAVIHRSGHLADVAELRQALRKDLVDQHHPRYGPSGGVLGAATLAGCPDILLRSRHRRKHNAAAAGGGGGLGVGGVDGSKPPLPSIISPSQLRSSALAGGMPDAPVAVGGAMPQGEGGPSDRRWRDVAAALSQETASLRQERVALLSELRRRDQEIAELREQQKLVSAECDEKGTEVDVLTRQLDAVAPWIHKGEAAVGPSGGASAAGVRDSHHTLHDETLVPNRRHQRNIVLATTSVIVATQPPSSSLRSSAIPAAADTSRSGDVAEEETIAFAMMDQRWSQQFLRLQRELFEGRVAQSTNSSQKRCD